MPVVSSTYLPPFWLRNAHAQTILRSLLPARPAPVKTTEQLDLPDGDFVELNWYLNQPEPAPLAVLCHGLEGSADSSYMLGMAGALHRSGCNALAWSYRGCGRQTNRLARSYHSGATEDLAVVVDRALKRVPGPLLLVGFSLGGNLILKYLGERTPPARIAAAAAVSAPVDLASSADALDLRRSNTLYRIRFLSCLNRKAAAKARRFPGEVPAHDWAAIRTVRAFDDAYTAPLHGFASADDYYARCSALQFLPRITIPTLLLNACDDPLLAPPSYPATLATGSPRLHLETPACGGHVAFLDRHHPLRSWLDTRVPHFLRHCLCPIT
jgi:predicted alpha/beta-fold hydrolase